MAKITVGENSYGTVQGLDTYATDRGITISGDKSILLIKAMDYLETRKYKGTKYLFSQSLQFPRSYYETSFGDSAGVVPSDIIKAQYVIAVLIDAGNDMLPVIDRETKKEKVDVLEVEYMDSAAAASVYPEVTALLGRFLKPSSNRVVRV